jgi:hypothetical protein
MNAYFSASGPPPPTSPTAIGVTVLNDTSNGSINELNIYPQTPTDTCNFTFTAVTNT